MKATFEKLSKDNSKEAVEIYNYYVTETTATYGTIPVDEAEFVSYYQIDNPNTVAVNILVDGKVVGFGMLKPWNARKLAFEHSYELTIYLHKDYCNMGLGEQVFNYLEPIAIERGIVAIMGVINAANTGSCKLCEKLGFVKCGHLQKIGKKFGKYQDLYYYQKLYD